MTKPLVAQFEDDINIVIDKYREQGLTIAEFVGTIETVKIEAYLGQRENEDDNASY